jgi:hypothetical protein
MRLWISSLVVAVLAPAPQAQTPGPAPASALSCTGEGTPWRLVLLDNRAWLSLPPARPVALEGRLSVEDSAAYGWRGHAVGREGGDVVAFVSETACPDASGEELPFVVRVSLPDGRFVSGCCRRTTEREAEEPGTGPEARPSPAPTPAPALGDWISSLPTYYPAIKECVQERTRVEAVVFAAIKPDKTTHLVLRLPGDRYADCQLPPGRGPAKLTLRPRGASRPPEEQAAMLSLSATPPPMEPCYRPQPVYDDKGERMGWASLKGC